MMLLSSLLSVDNMDRNTAEQLAGPFFGASLFPYLAFLWLLAREENGCPRGVTVGFATCLLFVFLTIPAAIASQILYGASLADCDWLHGSAESMLTITNLVTVLAFRQALNSKEKGLPMPASATSWAPMTWLVVGSTVLALATAIVPALSNPAVHTPYLGGFMDLPSTATAAGVGGTLDAPGWLLLSWANPEPDNALSVATWIIHISSLVEFLVAMGFAWRWGDVTGNPTWKGLTWGLLPLHSSGITACAYHLFYNRIPILVPLQALLTFVGNTTASIAAYRIARSNGWTPPREIIHSTWTAWADSVTGAGHADPTSAAAGNDENESAAESSSMLAYEDATGIATEKKTRREESQQESFVGFEDLGQALAGDTDYSFLLKLFAGCAVASYMIKYGETLLDFPNVGNNVPAGLAFVLIPSALNAYKWHRRGQDPTFEGWF
jgi:Protein of unknown function (DUF3593)/Protein of unknown function (DUF2499)